MRLRGYDEYEVTLGDQMRGERACLGKTIQDAERDLRIKAHVIRAIEDCDLDNFPNDSVVAGYVRSYARYLGLDAEDCYRRFCAESGFRSPVSSFIVADQAADDRGLKNIVAAGAALGSGLTQSRFAVKPAPARLSAKVSLGGLTSTLAMLGLVAGLGYGGYALLQDIQRVGFTPLPEAPEVVAETPLIAPPTVETGMLRRPDAQAYQGGGALAAIMPAETPPPVLPPRDGPISAIDPATSGVFSAPILVAAAEAAEAPATELTAETAIGTGVTPAAGETIAMVVAVTEGAGVTSAPAGPPKIAIHATDTAWIRVRDGDAAVVFEGTLAAGGRFELPDRIAAPRMRAGNAGAVYVLIDGAPYGPVGSSDHVLKNFSLVASDVTSQVPQASSEALGVMPVDAVPQQSAALVTQ